MMYNNQFVVALKSGGKVLREDKDTVRIPFGSEYSILMKNLSNRRASASVTIDGRDVFGGRETIIDAGSEFELERYVDSLIVGNKFKFIERTSKVESNRGVGLEDGIIVVRFAYEKPYVVPKLTTNYPIYRHPIWHQTYTTYSTGSPAGGGGISSSSNVVLCSSNAQTVDPRSVLRSGKSSDVGITVEGDRSEQRFVEVRPLQLEDTYHVICLKIVGGVAEPVFVKNKKVQCPSCGTSNASTAKFCSECGTAVTIYGR